MKTLQLGGKKAREQSTAYDKGFEAGKEPHKHS